MNRTEQLTVITAALLHGKGYDLSETAISNYVNQAVAVVAEINRREQSGDHKASV